jgi:hypothetical protein
MPLQLQKRTNALRSEIIRPREPSASIFGGATPRDDGGMASRHMGEGEKDLSGNKPASSQRTPLRLAPRTKNHSDADAALQQSVSAASIFGGATPRDEGGMASRRRVEGEKDLGTHAGGNGLEWRRGRCSDDDGGSERSVSSAGSSGLERRWGRCSEDTFHRNDWNSSERCTTAITSNTTLKLKVRTFVT